MTAISLALSIYAVAGVILVADKHADLAPTRWLHNIWDRTVELIHRVPGISRLIDWIEARA